MIYLIEAIGIDRVKIGHSITVEQRLMGIQTGCPVDCKLLAVIEGDQPAEKQLHLKWRNFRVRGEWFIKAQEILDYFGVIPEEEPDEGCLTIEDCARLMSVKVRSIRREIDLEWLQTTTPGGSFVRLEEFERWKANNHGWRGIYWNWGLRDQKETPIQ